jgi:hypothetical protein
MYFKAIQGHDYELKFDQIRMLSLNFGRNGFIKSAPGRPLPPRQPAAPRASVEKVAAVRHLPRLLPVPKVSRQSRLPAAGARRLLLRPVPVLLANVQSRVSGLRRPRQREPLEPAGRRRMAALVFIFCRPLFPVQPTCQDGWYGQMWHFILCREHNNRHRSAVGCTGTPIISSVSLHCDRKSLGTNFCRQILDEIFPDKKLSCHFLV